MGYYGWDHDKTVYNSPEAFGLEIVGEVNYSEGYDWSIAVVFRDKQTRLYALETDSGCSCNSPFEYVDSTKDFEWKTPHEVAKELQENAKGSAVYYEYDRPGVELDTAEVIGRLVA